MRGHRIPDARSELIDGQDRARPCAGRPRPVDRRVRRAAPQPGTARADGRGRDPRLSGRPRLGRAAERSDGTGPRAVVPAGVSHRLCPRRRRRHPLPASHAVGRRSERRVRRGIPAGLDRDRPPPGVQDRNRRVHRRADGAVRISRSAVRRGAARVLHHDRDARHLRHRVAPLQPAARRFACRHRTARVAHRAARRRRACSTTSPPRTVPAGGSTSERWTWTPSSSSSGTWVRSP